MSGLEESELPNSGNDRVSESARDDAWAEDVERLYTEAILKHSRARENGDNSSFRPPDVILIVALNQMHPSAAFMAPSLEVRKCTFLPAFEGRRQRIEASYTSSEYNSGGSKSSYFDKEWTEEFLIHCRKLLESELGRKLDALRVQVSFMAGSNTSEEEKYRLSKAAEVAGLVDKTDDRIRILPTIEAATIELIESYGNFKKSKAVKVYQTGALDDGKNILVIHQDGDVAEIQAYRVSRSTEIPESANTLRLEEIVSGETVNWGEMVDQQFVKWLSTKMPGVSEDDFRLDRLLMKVFATVRRNYMPKQQESYKFSITPKKSSSPGATKSWMREICFVEDSDIASFFQDAAMLLFGCLGSQHKRVDKEKKTIDRVVFIGASDVSPYLEHHVENWVKGNPLEFPVNVRNFVKLESTPQMIAHGAIRRNYTGVKVLNLSQAHYGFGVTNPFVEKLDPEWSRKRGRWDGIDRCSCRVLWNVHKGQRLDSNANVESGLIYHLLKHDAKSFSLALELFKCELDKPPRWSHISRDTIYPEMILVGKVLVKFNQEDIGQGELKLCDDGKSRRRLRFMIQVQLEDKTRLLKVEAKASDGRTLGKASFEY